MPNLILGIPASSSDDIAKKDLTIHHLNQQEFDFLVIIPKYRAYCHLEVKAGKAYGACIDQLKKGEDLFKMVQAYLGEEEYKDWKFIPVSVFPNSKVRPNQGRIQGGGGGTFAPPDRFREGRSPPLRFRGKKCSQFATIIF